VFVGLHENGLGVYSRDETNTFVRVGTAEMDGHFSEPVPGHADGTGVATDPSVGITEPSWLVISR
jgi:hypothetical protein